MKISSPRFYRCNCLKDLRRSESFKMLRSSHLPSTELSCLWLTTWFSKWRRKWKIAATLSGTLVTNPTYCKKRHSQYTPSMQASSHGDNIWHLSARCFIKSKRHKPLRTQLPRRKKTLRTKKWSQNVSVKFWKDLISLKFLMLSKFSKRQSRNKLLTNTKL